MAFVNYNSKEITVKIVYYGPALSGKTTCLKFIYTSKKFEKKGKLITLDTDGDRTLFFDFLPIEIGKLGDYSIKMQLYTVPGQVAYDTTRKLVLQGADGVAFVADSQVVMREQNKESFENLKVNLELNNISYSDIPIILLYNKKDLREILPEKDLNYDLNPEDRPYFNTVATNGENIIESLHEIMRLVIIYIKNRLSIFQKDKTVMFSRDEVVAQAQAKTQPPAAAKKDADKDIMELSSPIKESADDPFGSAEEEEDIFDLGELKGEEPGLDEEEPVALKEELIDDTAAEEEPSQPVRLEKAFELAAADALAVEAGVKTIKIPPQVIEIPAGKGEYKIDLNLQIVIKKT
ncbi:MAG: GTPase domain-containing protein [Candidatus Aminicenantes bacterium]|nr:GTPase domain-containing protein [Candidatus Aminicenantes bacterium]